MDYYTLVLLTIVALAIGFVRYIKFTKDVPDLYLSEQSIVEDTAKAGESTIHKSNKVDFARLRVGLDIRYDSYKSRNGNLSDVYQLLVKHQLKKIVINGETKSVGNLNHLVHQVVEYLNQNNISAICFKNDDFVKDFFGLALILAGFVSQTPVIIYDFRSYVGPDNSLMFNKFDFHAQFNLQGELSTFANEYTPTKDKGIAVTLVKQVHHNLISTVEFTQLNLVSAIASNIKHLPLANQWNDKDTVLITQSPKLPLEEASNSLVKILSTFVTNSNLIITCDFKMDHLKRYNPTILSTDPQVAKIINYSTSQQSTPQKLLQKLNLLYFKLGKSPRIKPISSDLRLVYITKNIQSPPFPIQELRASLGTPIIIESCNYRIISPIILNDFFDYRDFKISFDSFGCICQSLEIKLGDFNANKGYLMLRGYTIGKNSFEPSAGDENKNTEGFLPLESIRGSWGKDGCLYIGTA